MPSKSLFLLSAGLGLFGAAVACTRSNDATSEAADAGQDASADSIPDAGVPIDDAGQDSGIDPRRSYSPAAASRACKTKDDCALVRGITNCYPACGCPVAIARDPAYAAAVAACTPPGIDNIGCGLYCGERRAACFDGICVAESDAVVPPVPGPGPCGSGDAGASTGAPASPDPGASTACGVRGVKTGFEDGLDPSWTATNAAAFSIDRSEPLNGAASLRMRYAQETAHLTIAQPDACAARIAFTVRTRANGNLTLARIRIGETSTVHVQLGFCTLSIAEEVKSGGAASLGVGGTIGVVQGDTAVRVVLTVDVAAKTVSTVAAPLGQPFPQPTTTTLRGQGGIKGIDLGPAQGIAQSAIGFVWLDDLVID